MHSIYLHIESMNKIINIMKYIEYFKNFLLIIYIFLRRLEFIAFLSNKRSEYIWRV